MKKYAKIVNEETKFCEVGVGTNIEFYQSIGMTEQEVEQAYNGAWYLKGYAPQKPQEVKEQEVRAVREQYFTEYVDWYQSKPLLWEEKSEEDKKDIADYRNYLKDYTKQEEWWEQNPLNFEEWKNANLA
jgi:hypothetical protein